MQQVPIQGVQATTIREANELDRALERAAKAGQEVLAKGRRKSDNARVFCVPSQSHPGLWHLVALVGNRLVCECAAGKRGRICAHRAACHVYLTNEARDRRFRADAVERALEAEARQLATAAAPAKGQDMDAPLPVADNCGISIWK